jgi:hypothetical protein
MCEIDDLETFLLRALIQQATTDDERQRLRDTPNSVIVYWVKKDD